MYSSIFDLPSQVTASLDDKDAKVWMDTYNKENPKTKKEADKARRKAWRACKDLPSSFSFKIKASVDAVDKDREIIDVDSIAEHLDSYIAYGGPLQHEHTDYSVGCIWDWAPTDFKGMKAIEVWGNIYGGDYVYDKMREAFVKGTNSLSVAGRADKPKYQCDERGCYMRRNIEQLMEISLCTVPANKHCTLSWYNEDAKLTKSAGDIGLSVDEYEIHRTYDECPMLNLKKSLIDAGFDAHATEAGIMVSMTEDDFKKSLSAITRANLHAIWYDGAVCLNDMDHLTELSFKKGYREGYIDENGYLTDKVTKSFFGTLVERDVLEKDSKGYRLRI